MLKPLIAALLALFVPPGVAPAPPKAASTAARAAAATGDAPVYAAGGEMMLPANYREWVYLTSGLDMNYNEAAPAGHSIFDNVFVNPSSYRAFVATGAWPDKTTFILELRAAEAHVSIDRHGQSQTSDVRAVEIHVKDEAKLPGKWGFYNFGTASTGKLIARPATCYTCHEAHAAVDTTFVQFYPTLMGVAKAKGTLSAAYLEDNPPAAAAEGKK